MLRLSVFLEFVYFCFHFRETAVMDHKWWVFCPFHTERPRSEATDFSERKTDFSRGSQKKGQGESPNPFVLIKIQSKFKEEGEEGLCIFINYNLRLNSLETKQLKVRNMIEDRKELSNVNLAAFVWSVLYVSIVDLSTGSSLLMDLLLFKGL